MLRKLIVKTLCVCFFIASFLCYSKNIEPGHAGAAATPLPSPGFAIGEVFPDIVLPSLKDGSPLSLAQFRGKKIILHIFASW